MENSACLPQEYVNNQQYNICEENSVTTTENVDNFPVHSNTWNFRPHGSLARALYEKQLSDEQIDSMDKNQVCVHANFAIFSVFYSVFTYFFANFICFVM